MGQALEDWMLEHMHGVLIGVEIMWVGGFLAVFVVYFWIWRGIQKKKKAAQGTAETDKVKK